jgi:hypothetical protein
MLGGWHPTPGRRGVNSQGGGLAIDQPATTLLRRSSLKCGHHSHRLADRRHRAKSRVFAIYENRDVDWRADLTGPAPEGMDRHGVATVRRMTVGPENALNTCSCEHAGIGMASKSRQLRYSPLLFVQLIIEYEPSTTGLTTTWTSMSSHAIDICTRTTLATGTLRAKAYLFPRDTTLAHASLQ